MELDMPAVVVQSLWRKLADQSHLWVVLYQQGLPWIEDPDNVTQEEYLSEGESEALVLTFVTEEDALHYAALLPEMHDDLRPSMLTVVPIEQQDLFSMIEELNEASIREFDFPIRIDVAQRLEGDNVLADVLYSPHIQHN